MNDFIQSAPVDRHRIVELPKAANVGMDRRCVPPTTRRQNQRCESKLFADVNTFWIISQFNPRY